MYRKKKRRIMAVGIDATSLCRKITGMEYYTLNLVKTILKIDDAKDYVIFFRKEIHPELQRYESIATFIVCPLKNQIFCEQIWLPYIVWRKRIELMHFPAFPPGILTLKSHIVTIFDATIWKYSSTLSWKAKLYLKPLTILATKRALKVLTISENSKKDIVEHSKLVPDRVENTSMAISEVFKLEENIVKLERIKKKYNLNTRFILSVCSLEPRKNLENLLHAFLRLKKNNPKVEHKLVLIGREAWGKTSIRSKVRELELQSDVLIYGYVPQEDLVGFYNLAEIFVYVSLYEGFGLPPLEAMACGTPVVSSNTSSLPEVLNDAAFLIDPLDPREIERGMMTLLQNPDFGRKLSSLGIKRVQKYSWEKVARKIINIYQSHLVF